MSPISRGSFAPVTPTTGGPVFFRSARFLAGQSPRVVAGFQYSKDSDHNVNRTYAATALIPGAGLGDDALSPTLWQAHYEHTQIRETGGDVGHVRGAEEVVIVAQRIGFGVVHARLIT